MESRLDYWKSSPQGLVAFRKLSDYVRGCGLEPSLMELVKVRCSQINRCAFCLDMHTKDARLAGDTEQRLYALPAWQETPFFTERERAGLAWAEAITCIADDEVDDALYEKVRRYFSEKEIVYLTLAIITINGWNRLAIPFRTPAGSYEPGSVAKRSSDAPQSAAEMSR
jgi:AhpD family alkylhydroperoxidase